MKIDDFKRAQSLLNERQRAIYDHGYASEPSRLVVMMNGTHLDHRFVDAARGPILALLRADIEKAEADLRALGVEVEPHFKTDADGWLKPTGELAEELTKRGYTLVQTGGGCTAWVKVMADGDNVVVTDTQGTSDAGYDDWIVGRYDGDDWENGDAAASEDNDKGETIWQVIERYENTPRQPAELFDRAPFRSEDDGA